MKKLILAVSFFFVVSTNAIASPLTPENVSADLAKRSPAAVVADLSKNGRYEKILDLMDKGKEEWILLAPALAKGTDAGTSESLVFALAMALQRNPRAVLSVIRTNGSPLLAADQVCSPPMIEPTKKQLASYFKQAIAGVSNVSNPELSAVKAACLQNLEKVKAIP
jgi:hypothetical protein